MSNGIGILTLALGSETYRQLAINLALSLRKWSSLPIAVVVSPNAENGTDIGLFFDHVIICNDPTVPVGCAAKLHVEKLTPFAETLFIDADCLLYGSGLDDLLLSYDSFFMMIAEYKTSGRWGSARIRNLANLIGEKRYLKTNSGAFYWKSSKEADLIFQCARKLFDKHKIQLSWKIGLNESSYNDEPILCAALTLAGWEPEGQKTSASKRSLMISTIGAKQFQSNVEVGTVFFMKNGLSQNPLLCHYCGLNPRFSYKNDVDFLRKEVGLDPFEFPSTHWKNRMKLQVMRYIRFIRSVIFPTSIGPRISLDDLNSL